MAVKIGKKVVSRGERTAQRTGECSNHRLTPILFKRNPLVRKPTNSIRSLGESISTTGLYNIVRKRGGMIGKPDLQPHDLRRTYAELGRRAGVPISQISKLLGHSSLETTQEYLNIELDLEMTISDFVPF